jgi:small-conductance mechanosensitive channel
VAEKTAVTDMVKTAGNQLNYVILDNDTLFQIKASLGPYFPHERVERINERLAKFVKFNTNSNPDFFSISEANNYSVISYKELPILSLGIADADSANKTREKLALEYTQILKKSFEKKIKENSFSSWVRKIGYTILTLIGLVIIFFLLNKLFAFINKKLIAYEKGIKRKRKNVLKYLFPNKSGNIFLVFSKIIKIAFIILILFLYLPLLFSFLPWTEKIVEQFYLFISVPVKHIVTGFINFIPNIFFITIIYLISHYIIKVTTYISEEIAEDRLKLKGFHKDWARPTFKLLKIIIYAFTLVFMFPYLPGSDSKAFQGVSIFLGILFSLGSTSAISNIVAGIVITYMRPFIIGDRVKIGETVGDVIEKNLLVTRLKTIKNEDITIPNATIINTHLWNYSKNASTIGIILHPTVTIGYNVPSEQVIELLLNAAKNTKNLTREFKPFVLQKSLNDFYVEYELNVYTKQPKKMAHFYSELHKTILDEFNKAGVEILSPHYSAFRDGNASTIPEEPKPADNPVEKVIDKITGKKKA